MKNRNLYFSNIIIELILLENNETIINICYNCHIAWGIFITKKYFENFDIIKLH